MIIMKKLDILEKQYVKKLYFFKGWMFLIVLVSIILTTLITGAVKSEASQRDSIVDKALSQVGKAERKAKSDDIEYNDWYYGHRVSNPGYTKYAWCHVFVSWCANQCGINENIIIKTANCQSGVNFFKKQEDTKQEQVGIHHKKVILFILLHLGSTAHHVGIVYSVDSSKVYYVDGNNTTTTPHSVKKSSKKRNDSTILGYGMPAYTDAVAPNPEPVVNPNPAPNPGSAQDPVPSINSVTINGIDNGSIGFSFSVSNGTLAKVVIESTLTGKTKVDSFTSNLSNITYTFNRMSMPTGGNQYHIYLYAYSGSANNYKNEQVHKMTYGPAMQCVTFPDTISNDQMKILTFNARFYADMYEDVRKAFGYDEKMLYKHWLNEGVKEGRIGCPGYCGSFYLKNHGDIANAYGAKNYELAFYHYTTYGYKEERESLPVFSASYYLKNNGDIANAYGKNNLLQAAIHYNMYGINELRNSSIYYYGQCYKDKNGDLSKMTPYELLLHYYKYGIKERRYANSGNKVPSI